MYGFMLWLLQLKPKGLWSCQTVVVKFFFAKVQGRNIKSHKIWKMGEHGLNGLSVRRIWKLTAKVLVVFIRHVILTSIDLRLSTGDCLDLTTRALDMVLAFVRVNPIAYVKVSKLTKLPDWELSWIIQTLDVRHYQYYWTSMQWERGILIVHILVPLQWVKPGRINTVTASRAATQHDRLISLHVKFDSAH